MKQIQIANTDIKASQIILGCMRMNEPSLDAAKIIQTAYDNGVNFFDQKSRWRTCTDWRLYLWSGRSCRICGKCADCAGAWQCDGIL